jgi:hypothetical protein
VYDSIFMSRDFGSEASTPAADLYEKNEHEETATLQIKSGDGMRLYGQIGCPSGSPQRIAVENTIPGTTASSRCARLVRKRRSDFTAEVRLITSARRTPYNSAIGHSVRSMELNN